MNTNHTSIPVSRIQVTDPFWAGKMELVRTKMIPYQWNALNDQVPGAAPSFCMRNFKVAAKMNREREALGAKFTEPAYTFRGFETLPDDPNDLKDQFYGFVFQDSDFYKWIEAVAYSLVQHPDPELEALADGAVDIVCEAQAEDGYLDTYYILNGRDHTFKNLRDHHELYCLGHLIEGAVAYHQATGKDKLLKAAMRYADFAANYFGPEPGKCKGYPGHEIAEMALVRLYEETGEEKYLNLSRYFIDERGQQPNYFALEHPEKKPDEDEILRFAYQQAHMPVRDQDEAVGHAVRAVYLYSGMADISRITQDDSLRAACERLWDNIVNKKMYITGGIGGTVMGEAFSFNYDLPNDAAYAETCAAIGLVFFARRMLELHPDAKYANVMERALYNCVLSGMSLDGTEYFYVNPLEVDPEACRKDERKSHVKPVRQKWFGCACCPPNLARLLSSVGTYAYTETDDTLFVHLYMGSSITKTVDGRDVTVTVESGLPRNGDVTVTVVPEGAHSGDEVAATKSELSHYRDEATDTGSESSSFRNEATDTGSEPSSFRNERTTAGTELSQSRNETDVNADEPVEFTIALRIPDWCDEYTVDVAAGCCAADTTAAEFMNIDHGYASMVAEDPVPYGTHLSRNCLHFTGNTAGSDAHFAENSTCQGSCYLKDGYLYITRKWNTGDRISLHFPLKVRLYQANTHVREDIGKTAVGYGPVIYCAEEADNDKDLHLLTVDRTPTVRTEAFRVKNESVTSICVSGHRQKAADEGEGLYHVKKAEATEAVEIRLIPYYTWANRGENEMSVWIRQG
ncbi:MAG: glycoside hydrolase family 127 protein [Lachnospiraceae bacterium]|nr:glycoside hydrolase family 127 protein [Lachnospiraceae bacterium]